MPTLARSVLKPLTVPSLARSVPKPLKVPTVRTVKIRQKKGLNRGVESFFLSEANFVVECRCLKFDRKMSQNRISVFFLFLFMSEEFVWYFTIGKLGVGGK